VRLTFDGLSQDLEMEPNLAVRCNKVRRFSPYSAVRRTKVCGFSPMVRRKVCGFSPMAREV
jgi:hypothetical protein